MLKLGNALITRIERAGIVVHTAKPRFLPVELAARLAAAVAQAVAAEILEIDRIVHATASGGRDRVANLVHTT